MNTRISLIIQREYLERVKRKSFIITTILMPILMVGMMVAPTLIMLFAGTEERNVAVVDHSGVIAQSLQGDGDTRFCIVKPVESMDQLQANEDFDAILVLGSDVVDNPGNVTLYTHGAPSMKTEEYIRRQIEDAIEEQRLARYDIENLKAIIDGVHANVEMETFRIDKEEAEATSSLLSYIIGFAMMMMLYMFIMIYGQMVMTSIIEEKNNRVLEIMVSSVRPQALMMGKIMGIALVALTQIAIWGVLLVSSSRWLMPVLPMEAEGELGVAMAQLSDVSYVAGLIGMATVFLACGFLFYSSIYAAIGSAVDNIQDASQLAGLAVYPILFGLIVSMVAINDPNSSIAVWASMLPFTSPMVMMARLPFGIPLWQTAVSILILVVSFLAMLWLSAKVYRVGIFMYGKKASLKDIIRWMRYK